jgi:hypothetical protein
MDGRKKEGRNEGTYKGRKEMTGGRKGRNEGRDDLFLEQEGLVEGVEHARARLWRKNIYYVCIYIYT